MWARLINEIWRIRNVAQGLPALNPPVRCACRDRWDAAEGHVRWDASDV